MKRRLATISRPAVAFLLLLFAFNSTGLPREMGLHRSLVASGTSPLTRQDSADARNLALKEALRSAVEQSLGWLLPAETIVRFYPLLLNRILAQATGYVQDYQIIHEGNILGLYRVTVQTTLHAEGLKRDLGRLGLFLADSERPRVVIMVAERSDLEETWQWWWKIPAPEDQKFAFTEALAGIILARGLVPLNPTLLLNDVPENLAYQEPLLADTLGIELAKTFGAQVVVLGQVSHQAARAGAPAMVRGSLRALGVNSRQTLAQVSGTVEVKPAGAYEVVDQGFTALAERLAPDLVDGVLTPFVTVSRAPEEITVQILGVQSYGDLILIKQRLQRISEVKDIKQIQLKSGTGYFTVVLAGNRDSLRGAFTEEDFGSFTTSAGFSGEDSLIVTIHNKR